MSMTVEELLKPRWKVIAGYPAAMFEVGDIIKAYENGITYMVEINDASEKYSMNDYPHLFQPLAWWMDRKVEDLPEYLKSEKGKVWKVWEYIKGGDVQLKKNIDLLTEADTKMPYVWHSLYLLNPATETDYHTFIESKK